MFTTYFVHSTQEPIHNMYTLENHGLIIHKGRNLPYPFNEVLKAQNVQESPCATSKSHFSSYANSQQNSKTILTSFLIPPWCLTIRRALLNLATLAMVSAAKHFSSLLGDVNICTNIGRPAHKTFGAYLHNVHYNERLSCYSYVVVECTIHCMYVLYYTTII